METNNSLIMALIEQLGVAALRVGFTVAVIVFLLAGVFIWRRRHQFFDRDSNVARHRAGAADETRIFCFTAANKKSSKENGRLSKD